MCLREIGVVRSVDVEGGLASVDFGSRVRDIPLLVLDDPSAVVPGTWLEVAQGYALDIIGADEALAILTTRAEARERSGVGLASDAHGSDTAGPARQITEDRP